MTVTRVRIPSTWQEPGAWGLQGRQLYATAEFGLGVGPCGKTVVVLEVNYHSHGVEIVQVCSCTERKVFVYPWHTITGRVEVTYG